MMRLYLKLAPVQHYWPVSEAFSGRFGGPPQRNLWEIETANFNSIYGETRLHRETSHYSPLVLFLLNLILWIRVHSTRESSGKLKRSPVKLIPEVRIDHDPMQYDPIEPKIQPHSMHKSHLRNVILRKPQMLFVLNLIPLLNFDKLLLSLCPSYTLNFRSSVCCAASNGAAWAWALSILPTAKVRYEYTL